jgi:hypothetical protein
VGRSLRICSDSSGYPRCRPVDLAKPDQAARRGQQLQGPPPIMPGLPPLRGLVALGEVVGMAPDSPSSYRRPTAVLAIPETCRPGEGVACGPFPSGGERAG